MAKGYSAIIPVAPKFEARRMTFNVIDNLVNPVVILPPLYMHINPQNMDQTFKKKTHRYQTFSAYVEEFWGEELDTISCNASTGGFILKDMGLTALYRVQTQPYFKFQDILDIYRNNGNTYDNFGRITKKGTIVLSYDEGTYYGYFENFNYTEDGDKPFKFIFDFTFKISNSILGI